MTESADSDDQHHSPSHNLLQIRRPLFVSEISQLMSGGQTIIEGLSDSGTDGEGEIDDSRECTFCNKVIETRPYWCCVECIGESLQPRLHWFQCLMLPPDNPYICFECNQQHEEDAPWQLQRKPADDEAHDYMHVLVLASKATKEEDVSTDDRLTALDAKFEENVEALQTRLAGIESTLSTRLQTLEDLLQHLILTVSEPRRA